MKTAEKLAYTLSWLGLGLFMTASALAEPIDISAEENQGVTQSAAGDELPHYTGEGAVYFGFRWVDIDDSNRGAEYEEDESSLLLGIDGLACPLPHRYHMNVEYFGEHNYFSDVGYAYRDLLLFRNITVGVHHNLDNYSYQYPGSPPLLVYEERNPGLEPYIDFLKNELFMRGKAPDYPMHIFLEHRFVGREGTLQERFLNSRIGSVVKTSESRDINWESQTVSLGANSHLGPMEIEYIHDISEFDPGPGSILYDFYPQWVFGRPADVYPHNVVPETESYGNSLKLHTSYTGRIVASATLGNATNTNNYSGAETDAWKAAMDIRWLPDPIFGLFLKYRHRELDKETPAQTTLIGRTHRLTYSVRPAVSTRKDIFSLSGRYRPLTRLTLIGNYEFEKRQRSDVDAWELLPENSEIHTVNVTANARPLTNLKLKGVFEYRHYENPAYNTEPDDQNGIRLNAAYTPVPWLTALLDYNLILARRDNLHYLSSTRQVLDEGERDGRTDRFLGSLSFAFSPKASLTATWSYYRWDVDQDLADNPWVNSGGPDNGRSVPYTDKSNTFGLSLFYIFRENLTFTSDLTYTKAEGDFAEQNSSGVFSSLASLSSMETTETAVSLEVARKVLQNWELGLKFYADFYDDEFSNISKDHQDGELYVTTFSIKRYF